MKLFGVSAVLSAILISAQAGEDVTRLQQMENAFDHFKEKYNKTYINPIEESIRKQLFLSNFESVEKQYADFLAGTESYYLGINQFADQTEEELGSCVDTSLFERSNVTHKVLLGAESLPKFFDWQVDGFVLPSKDQGDCGSCWAFAATTCIETQYAKLTDDLIYISPQYLVDCSKKNNNCKGGMANRAFADIIETGGIETEETYPYEGIMHDIHRCQSKKKFAATLASYVDIPSGDENAIMDALIRFGPIAVAMNARHGFRKYRGGVWNSCPPNVDVTHAVTIVGYGVDDDNQEYWTIKNSWGSSWGERGFARIARGVNMCGIANYASYPIVQLIQDNLPEDPESSTPLPGNETVQSNGTVQANDTAKDDIYVPWPDIYINNDSDDDLNFGVLLPDPLLAAKNNETNAV